MGPPEDALADRPGPVGGVPPTPSTFVTVLAWLGIVYHGAMLVVGGLEAILFWPYFSDPAALQALMPMPQGAPMPMDVLQLGSRIFALVFAVFLVWAVGGLVASVALLQRRNWGRLATIALLALGIAWMAMMLLWQGVMGSMPIPPQVAGGPGVPEFLHSVRIALAVVSILFAAGYGWLIAKLVSKPIRAEFLPRGD
jgi:hypothetical protein